MKTKMDLQKQIEALKLQRIQEIMDDNNVSKIQKIKLFEKEQLFNCAPYIQHEFPDWEIEAVELEKLEAERILKEGCDNPNEICAKQFYQSKMTDTIFDPSTFYYEKYETVSYSDSLQNCLENALEDISEEEYDAVDKDNPIITVITTRHPHTELKKPYNEIIDKVYEFCITNKIWGFKNDW